MANVYAVKSGNWSDTTVWNTGSLPTSADDVYSNNFVVTVDGTFTVNSVRNAASSPIVAGGYFALANGANLTATSGFFATANNPLVGFSLASPSSATITGQLSRSSPTGSVCRAARNDSSGTLNIIGNIFGDMIGGGIPQSNACVDNTSSGTINITGNISIPSSGVNGSWVVYNTGVGTINITGNCSTNSGGSSSAVAAHNASTGTMNIVGSCQGSLNGGAGGAYGALNSFVGTLNITGTVTGGLTTSLAFGAINSSSGTMTIIGPLVATTCQAVGGSSSNQVTLLQGPFIANALYGIVAVSAHSWRWASNTVPTYMSMPTSYLTQSANLYTTDSVSVLQTPANNNVRSGVVYGPLSEYTGTMAVPDANTVAYGVPVGNTTGTILMDANTIAQYVWNHPTANIVTSGTIGMRLKNAATIEVVGDQVEALS